MVNGELQIRRLQKLICLHLFTDCFMKISLHTSPSEEWREIFRKQSATNADK